jgi:hypothetical protein
VKEHICAVAAVVLGMVGVTLAQPARQLSAGAQAPGRVAPQVERCLHDRSESAAEKARREEAMAAMRMIDYVIEQSISVRVPRAMDWDELARSPHVGTLRLRKDAVGDLARKIAWGLDEPLPGWQISWLAAPRPAYTLTDTHDACAFKLSSDDPTVVPNTGRELRIVPLDTY